MRVVHMSATVGAGAVAGRPALLRLSRRAALASALVAGLAAASLLAPVEPAMAQARPSSLADLVDSVAEAVVNISATQTIEEKQADAMPDLPAVTVSPRPKGLPTAITPSPTRILSLSPNLTVLSGLSLLTAQHGDVDFGEIADDLRLQFTPIGEDDHDVVGVTDDVIVGDDDARGVDHEAGAQRARFVGRGASPFWPWLRKNCSNISSNGVPRQLGQRFGVLFLDRLRRGNVHNRFGDAVDEIGERGRLGLRESRRGRGQEERRRAASRERRSPSSATPKSDSSETGEHGGGGLDNAHGVFLLGANLVRL